MKKLIQQVSASLNDKEDIVLATISSQSGSTPRLAGAKMLIRRDGSIAGTIGGGLVEAQAIEEAQNCFHGQHCLYRAFDFSNKEAAMSDMICGGKMELFLDFVPAKRENRELFHSLSLAMAAGRRAALVCPLESNEGQQRFIIDHNGKLGHGTASDEMIGAVKKIRSSTSAATMIEVAGAQYLVSYFAVGSTLFLLGAGHVAACTAEAANRVGFRTVVMDDRGEFANRERFPHADEIQVLSSFNDCFNGYEIDKDSFLVIVTRGHLHDLEVLEQAMKTQAGYIGMIGSRKKRNTIYDNLIDKGVKPEQLERVRCPIGMAIEADTPEEIAVSIIGELIYQRATGRKPWHLA